MLEPFYFKTEFGPISIEAKSESEANKKLKTLVAQLDLIAFMVEAAYSRLDAQPVLGDNDWKQ